MTVDVKEFERLKSDVARLQREADKAAGAHAEQMKRLKEEFGCDSIEAAEKLLKGMKKEAEAAESKFDKAMAAFKRKWADQLEQR